MRGWGFAAINANAQLSGAGGLRCEIDCTAGWIVRRPVVEMAQAVIAIRRSTDEQRAQTRVASARVRGLPPPLYPSNPDRCAEVPGHPARERRIACFADLAVQVRLSREVAHDLVAPNGYCVALRCGATLCVGVAAWLTGAVR